MSLSQNTVHISTLQNKDTSENRNTGNINFDRLTLVTLH